MNQIFKKMVVTVLFGISIFLQMPLQGSEGTAFTEILPKMEKDKGIILAFAARHAGDDQIDLKITLYENVEFTGGKQALLYLDLDNNPSTGRQLPEALQGTDVLAVISEKGLSFVYFNNTYKNQIKGIFKTESTDLHIQLKYSLPVEKGVIPLKIPLLKFEKYNEKNPSWYTLSSSLPARKSKKEDAYNPELHEPIATREPLYGRTYVYSRSQVQYTMHLHYLHSYIDRPLYHDMSTFYPEEQQFTLASYKKVLRAAQEYGIDGMAFLTGSGTHSAGFLRTVDYFDQIEMKGMHIIPEFAPGLKGDTLKRYEAALEKTIASKYALRFGTKAVVSSYLADQEPPEEWQRVLSEMKRIYGDTFVFLPQLRKLSMQMQNDFSAYGTNLPGHIISGYKKTIRSYLDVTDGLYFQAMLKEIKNGGFATFPRSYFETMIRIGAEVLAEPPYKEKIFALGIWQLHYNHYLRALSLNEDGTRTLRNGFEAAMEARPDIIVLIEWDEVNENTSHQPTICNSFSSQRIIKYYMHLIKGETPLSNKGDDKAIPNLIICYRRMIKGGETLEIELLNVPDTKAVNVYTAVLSFKDLNGKTVKRFPEAKFNTAEMKEIRHIYPGAEAILHHVLIPSLEITDSAQKKTIYEAGLHEITAHPSTAYDYKWIKQPLRDIIKPTKAFFSAVRADSISPVPDTAAGALITKASFACGEEIASAEIISDGTELYGFDKDNRFGFDDPDNILFRVSIGSLFRPFRGGYEKITGTFTVNGSSFELLPDKRDNQKPADTRTFKPSGKDSITAEIGTSLLGFVTKGFFIRVPKTSLNRAVLDIRLSFLTNTISLSYIAEKGIFAEVFDGGVVFVIERYTKLPLHPFHTGKKEINFSAAVYPEQINFPLHLRVITTTGKIYRSPPVMPLAVRSDKTMQIPVYCDVTGKTVRAAAPLHTVREIVYDFTTNYGAILYTKAGRGFYGMLGAGPPLAIGKLGAGQETGGNIFKSYSERNFYPKNNFHTAPKWKLHDKRHVIDFDGQGNLLSLPSELLPRGAFSLEFEIMPLENKACTLFIHHGHYTGFFQLQLDNDNKVCGNFINWDLGKESFTTDLAITKDEWSIVRVQYDLERITITVNGKDETFVPEIKKPFFYPMPCAFGGFGSGNEYFKGMLRALSVYHFLK